MYKINVSAIYSTKNKTSYVKNTSQDAKYFAQFLFTDCISSGLTHSIVALTHSFSDPSELVNENHIGTFSVNLCNIIYTYT